ncbi:MAG TPA: NUDIX domain-containing protein [Mycobacteriales bacterium]|jgi:8-oxo-dGTP pyrophosphatase MutT (NUDIX family)|nr:NUDIX domain-containing protein [Mycobacteriales bacterium]
MATTEVFHRPGVRVLLLDPDGRVLLFRGSDPARPDVPPYWFTVGGGLEPGESAVDGAIRETYEETGVRLAPADLSGPVWHEVVEYPFENVLYRQPQDFYVVRLGSARAVDTSGFDDVELRTVDAHRWWTAAEIRASAETVYPRCLADLVEGR